MYAYIPQVSNCWRRTYSILSGGYAPAGALMDFCFEPGKGTVPTVCVPGFVPKCSEAFFMQKEILKSFGNVWFAEYASRRFSLELVLAQLADLVEHLAERGTPPVIMSASFGSVLVLQLLRSLPQLPVKGYIFVSPITGLSDMYDPQDMEDATFVGRIVASILQAGQNNGRQLAHSIERARKAFYRMLFVGTTQKSIPAELERLKMAVFRTIKDVDATGVYERIAGIRHLKGLSDDRLLTRVPTLILWGEVEHHVIREKSLNYQLLRNDPAKVFPRGKSVILKSDDPVDKIQHASLIFHAEHFNARLRDFYCELCG